MTEVVLSPAPIASPVETERQAAELAAMRRMIDASQGCFSLSIAVCNSPALRDYLIGQLCRSFFGIQVASIPAGTRDIFTRAAADIRDLVPVALFVVNLEASVPSAKEGQPTVDKKTQPTLDAINASRELWERRFPCPIVFWLPEYAATLLSTHARDFWRYRSHRFEFVSEQAGAIAGMADGFSGKLDAAASLSADEKRFRIAELEQRIAEAGQQPPASLLPHVPVWLNELGFLFRFIGDLDRAEEMHRKAMEIDERLGRLEWAASNYGNLGIIYQVRGDLGRAEEMYRKALEINERLGRVEGMAVNYGNLGIVHGMRGDLSRAEEMFRKALEIDQRLGRLEGMASNYGNLGIVYQMRGALGRAEEMSRKAMEIDQRLGRLEGMANGYGSLGNIYQMRGDMARAEEMHRKALEINERLGRLEGMANNYGNLGNAYRTRGDMARAEEMYRKALEIDERLGLVEGIAKNFDNLGIVYRTRGDLDQAEEMHRKALEIDERLGLLEGMAGDYGNLGIVCQARGDLETARELWTKSRDLFLRIGAHDRARRTQERLDRLGGSDADLSSQNEPDA